MSALPVPRRRILPATPSTALTTSRPGDLGAGPLQTKQPFGLTAGCGGHASWTHGPQHQGGEPRARDAAQLRSYAAAAQDVGGKNVIEIQQEPPVTGTPLNRGSCWVPRKRAAGTGQSGHLATGITSMPAAGADAPGCSGAGRQAGPQRHPGSGAVGPSDLGGSGCLSRGWHHHTFQHRRDRHQGAGFRGGAHGAVLGLQDPRPILFDGQAVIGATGRTMALPRYNAKMEARSAPQSRLRAAEPDSRQLPPLCGSVQFCAVRLNCSWCPDKS